MNYIVPTLKHISRPFPSNEIHLCFCCSCDVVDRYMLPGLIVRPGRKKRWESESANECGRCRVARLAKQCDRAQWGLKGMQEDVLGPRGGTGKGASTSWQIACLCGSQRPYIAFSLVPISPRLVFHPCPSGCNGVPWVSGWMEVWLLLTATAGTPFTPLKGP